MSDIIKKMTFIEYVHSKDNLREAIENTPKKQASYNVQKYCQLVVGETKQTKHHVPLKPKHKIKVDWLYENFESPTPVKIEIQNEITNESYSIHWKGDRLLKWLLRNTKEDDDFYS